MGTGLCRESAGWKGPSNPTRWIRQGFQRVHHAGKNRDGEPAIRERWLSFPRQSLWRNSRYLLCRSSEGRSQGLEFKITLNWEVWTPLKPEVSRSQWRVVTHSSDTPLLFSYFQLPRASIYMERWEAEQLWGSNTKNSIYPKEFKFTYMTLVLYSLVGYHL